MFEVILNAFNIVSVNNFLLHAVYQCLILVILIFR